MVSESLDIQVLVRAMYDFESEDATNLTFKKDDVIQVLAQLESGWWAGHCDGRQGWFPSNYVQVLEEADLDSQDEEDDGEDLDCLQEWYPWSGYYGPTAPTATSKRSSTVKHD
ncbi:hypothetical protein BGZ72_002206 [Mortierella alpina]|nr:hypothetical protein BGZ72_002206 [Mortierella alpina]